MTRSTLGRIARYTFTAAVVVLLVLFARTVNWHEAWASMRSASLPLLAAAIIVNLLSLLIRGVRWWILLRASGSPSLWLALKASVAGAGLNNVLVANGGDAARIVFVTRASGVPASKVLATAALDRIFDPIGFIFMLAWGVVAFHLPPQMDQLRWPALIGVALITAVLVWLARRATTSPPAPEHIPERRTVPRGWKSRLRAWVVEFGGSMRDLATGPRILGIIVLTLLAWVGQLVTFVCAAAAAHVTLPVPGSLAALLAVNVSLIIRATPGNVGFFQFAYALSTEPFGVTKEAAIAVSLLIQTLQIIPVTLLGVALAPEFLLRKRNVPELRGTTNTL
jgi:uncharacterized protein (TIRG00374 family)